MTLDTLEKIVPQYVKDNPDEFKKYHYGYIIKDNQQNIGIYLIKVEKYNIIKIKKIKGTKFIDDFITNKYLSYRFIVVNVN